MIRYKNLVERSPFPMAETEGPGHLLRHVNAAFCAMNGIDAQALLGKPIADILPASAAVGIVEMLDRVYLGAMSDSITFTDIAGRDSRKIRQSYTAWTIPETEEPADGIVIQISESNLDESVLQDNQEANDLMREINERLLITSIKSQEMADSAAFAEKKLSDVINGLNAIVCEMDVRTGRLTFINQPAQHFLGYSIEQWNEPGFWDGLIHQDDYDRVVSGFKVVTDEGRDHHFDFRVKASDGTWIWLRNIIRGLSDTKGNIIKLRCVIIDVTSQKESTALLSKALDRERHIADALQYSVLGEEPEDFYPGLSIATIYEPAMAEALVGGDFYDTLSLPEGNVMLVVGDVTGKGLKAAARTVEAKYALRAFAQSYSGPAENANHLNNYICRQHPHVSGQVSQFIALLIAVVNPANGRLDVMSAGAEPPFIVRASGEMEDIPTAGLMLGVEPGFAYTQLDGFLDAGDILVLTTDGITEIHHDYDFFGCDGIAQVIRQADASMSLHDIGKLIMITAREFGSGYFKDDVCLLLARRS